MRRKACTLSDGAAERYRPVCPLADWGRHFPAPSRCRKVQGRRTGSRPMGRSLPGSDPVRGVAQSDASGSSGSSGRPRAVRTARPGRSIARSAADHSSVPSSSTPAAAAPTA